MKIFTLTEEEAMLRELAKELARAEIRPRSEEADQVPCLPLKNIEVLAEAGLFCCMIPEGYGGAGLGYWDQAVVIETVAEECASTAWAVANTAEVATCLLEHGLENQKQAVLPALAGGHCASAAGNDACHWSQWEICAQAERVGNGFLLGGVKHNVPNIAHCDWFLVAATEEERLRWYLLNSDTPGLRTAADAVKLGMKGCAPGSLLLEDCTGDGIFALEGDVRSTLAEIQALNMAAIAVGIAQGAMNEAVQYINERIQFGKTIARFENTQFVMAELQARVEAARALVWNAARVKDAGEDSSCAAAMAKLVASDTACIVTRKCVQFMGGYGYSREYPVERKMRDAKMTELLGGTTEVQKGRIAESVVLR